MSECPSRNMLVSYKAVLVSDLICSCWDEDVQLEVILKSALSPKGQNTRLARVCGPRGL